MFGALNYATAVYRNELARRLHQLGYSTRRTGTAFEIEGVEPELLERFSKRSQQRDMAVKAREQKLGRKLTNRWEDQLGPCRGRVFDAGDSHQRVVPDPHRQRRRRGRRPRRRPLPASRPARPRPKQSSGPRPHQSRPLHRIPWPGRFRQKHRVWLNWPACSATKVLSRSFARPPLPQPIRCTRKVWTP
ncbi:MAG: hypothetical protein DME21_15855 [Verrucomicrobia bacterium]|nr:MAG: hypothetical protein DME21_15855 [Verrucomicrobiota bacterium]